MEQFREPTREECDKIGEQEVRERLYAGRYGAHKRPYVVGWLDEKEAERRAAVEAKMDASNAQHLLMVRSAKNAAWAAAIIAMLSMIAAPVMWYYSQCD